jgi:hypothetical protein
MNDPQQGTTVWRMTMRLPYKTLAAALVAAAIAVMQQVSLAGIHDAGLQESISPQCGSLLECNAVEAEVLLSVSSRPAFPARGWNADDLGCSVPPTV